MRNRTILIRITVLVLAFGAAVAFGALRICRMCGHENDNQGGVACSHCNALFPEPEKPVADPVDEGEDSGDGYIPRHVIDDEIAEGQKHLQDQKYELARLYFLNALSLAGGTDLMESDMRSEDLLAMVQSAELASRNVRKTCPRCGGSGQRQIVFEGLRSLSRGTTIGSERALSMEGDTGVRCQECGGDGTVHAVGTIDEMKYVRGRAAAEYSRLQQTRRFEPLGGTWVPPHLVDTLTARQKATIMRSIVLPCRSCGGYGRSDCRRCAGRGHTECRNCTEGRVPEDRSDNRVQRIGTNRTRECDTCQGAGTLPCRSCNEAGTIVCKACEGAGDADVCRACTARGYVTCNRCRGSKVLRGEACPHCRGEGYLVCSSCKGRGRRE